MSLAERVDSHIVNAEEFFAPMSADLVDGLVGEFEAVKARIELLAAAMEAPEHEGVLHHFIEGNVPDQRHTIPTSVAKLFRLEGAVAHLTAQYWDRALRLTDVIDYMPQARRDDWFEQIKNPLGKKVWAHEAGRGRVERWQVEPLPAFEEDTVRSTLQGLLASRSQFFAERVDGIFRSLSRNHVTNQPQGFGKRMIIPHVINSFGTIEYRQSGVINDLRCVIAKFMGRDEPKYGATDSVIRVARQFNGQWQGVDGNAFRIRIYNGVGTAHIEVHPDMAWRLNSVLAHLYPAAIPAEFRRKPKRQRKIKDFELFDRPLPFSVISLLAGLKEAHRRVENPGFNEPKFRPVRLTRRFDFDAHRADKYALAEAARVIEAIGGAKVDGEDHWQFDYEPAEVLDQIICTGAIPDQKSHQFYPTPAEIAQEVAERVLDGLGPRDMILEPSAGMGGLADFLPRDQVQCVEVSQLHWQVLRSKGYDAICDDFLILPLGQYDRIAMNPPFSEGRWRAHLERAESLLAPGGRLVAVLPESARGSVELPGCSLAWSGVYSNQFKGASVSVVILTAHREVA